MRKNISYISSYSQSFTQHHNWKTAHSQKIREKNQQNPKTLHDENMYISLEAVVPEKNTDARLSGNIFLCSAIFILYNFYIFFCFMFFQPQKSPIAKKIVFISKTHSPTDSFVFWLHSKKSFFFGNDIVREIIILIMKNQIILIWIFFLENFLESD